MLIYYQSTPGTVVIWMKLYCRDYESLSKENVFENNKLVSMCLGSVTSSFINHFLNLSSEIILLLVS